MPPQIESVRSTVADLHRLGRSSAFPTAVDHRHRDPSEHDQQHCGNNVRPIRLPQRGGGGQGLRRLRWGVWVDHVLIQMGFQKGDVSKIVPDPAPIFDQ